MQKYLISVLLIVAMGACQASQAPEEEAEAVTLEAPLLPTTYFQTGIHLQGVYTLPEWLLALEPFNTEMEYLLYLPDGYNQDPDRLWPLIVFLHGSGDDDFDSAFVMSAGLPEVLLSDDQPSNFEFVVVSPQSFFNTTWWDRATPTVVNALVDEVIATYQIDPTQVYLTGLSMGGYGAWYVAAANPDRYAALASISGSGYRTTTIPAEDVLCQNEEIPLWAIHGSRDQISDPNANRIYLEAYEEICDGEVNITFYPEEGHFGTFYKAYRDPALYDWFLSKTKPLKDSKATIDNKDHAN